MKTVLSRWLAVAVVALSTFAASPAKAQGSVSLQVFYDELQPYGSWVDHGRYGYVWLPNEGPDFVPYGTNGYWVQTAYGNTWVSNYSWGWAPFHYGRWFYDDFYGWMWVPDTVWGPAWVTWRSGGGYYGWAPLMPGLGISVNVGYYNSIPNFYWNFVPYRYVMYRQVYRHCVSRPRVVNVINNTTVIVNNNYYDHRGPSNGGANGRDRHDGRPSYFTGPSRSEMEQHNGERLPVYDVHDRTSPGRTEVSRNSVSVYKPTVEQNTRTRALPAQYTRDNDEGRQQFEQTRSRQVAERNGITRSGYDQSTDRTRGMRENDGAVPGGRSSLNTMLPRESGNRSSIDNEAPTRDRTGSDRTGRSYGQTETERPGRDNSVDRTTRDADFNLQQRERETDRLPRQQRDVQQHQQSQRSEQIQRMPQQREQGQREQQVQREQQMQREQQRQRTQPQSPSGFDRQQPRQSPSQQPQQRSTQPRQHQSAPQQSAPSRQREYSQPRVSTPSSPQRSGGSQRSTGSQSNNARTRSH